MTTAPEAIGSLILKKKYKVIAEVGVNACSFCDQLVKYLQASFYSGAKIKRNLLDGRDTLFPLREYWLIDPWPYGYELGSCGKGVTDEKWDALHWAACKRMVRNNNLRVLRMTSLEAQKLFPDNYFDLVYIDADHTYKSVWADSDAWIKKIRKGGAITGHDYSGGWQEVVQAVDDYFISRSKKVCKKFYEIDDMHYRLDSGVWVVEL